MPSGVILGGTFTLKLRNFTPTFPPHQRHPSRRCFCRALCDPPKWKCVAPTCAGREGFAYIALNTVSKIQSLNAMNKKRGEHDSVYVKFECHVEGTAPFSVWGRGVGPWPGGGARGQLPTCRGPTLVALTRVGAARWWQRTEGQQPRVGPRLLVATPRRVSASSAAGRSGASLRPRVPARRPPPRRPGPPPFPSSPFVCGAAEFPWWPPSRLRFWGPLPSTDTGKVPSLA